MPTKKPRLLITLEQPSYNTLKSISEASGRPMSSFVSELIEGAMPTLERMSVTFHKIKLASDAGRAKFLEGLDDAQSVLEPVVMECVDQFGLFMDKVDVAVAASASEPGRHPEGRAPGSGAAAASSPPTNRGVTPIRQTALQANNGKGLKGVEKKQSLKKEIVSKGHKSGLCTCTITEFERMENKSCPVHIRNHRHAV